jgi:hypothetical protein
MVLKARKAEAKKSKFILFEFAGILFAFFFVDSILFAFCLAAI